jgi:cation diffusion facilitator CzcD-associated flavoprotein CzcO
LTVLRSCSDISPRVAIIGGGMASIALGVRLKASGFDRFDIFEQSGGLGGTWHDARYPGAAVDTPVPMYSYSFTRTYSFSRLYSGQAELLSYLQHTADLYGVLPHFEFGSRVVSVKWDDDQSHYLVTVEGRAPRAYEVVVTAVGFLNNPRYPSWPHLQEFRGHVFHSARWTPIDLTGKRVAVVGTGSAAAQIVGAIAPKVGRLLVFQREPGWVMPKPDRVFTAGEKEKLARPWPRRIIRFRQYVATEIGSLRGARDIMQKPGGRRNRLSQQIAESYIAEVFAGRPDLAQLVTPSYPFGGKRIIKDSAYYPALLRHNVELVPRAVQDACIDGVIDASGAHHAVDIIVLATGYQASNYLGTLDVRGREGQSIRDYWDSEPTAFMGLTVPGFPNLFMMYGPNTNSVHLVHLFESQAAYIRRCIRRMGNCGYKEVEVKAQWHQRYNEFVERRLSRTATAHAVREGVHNYYATPSGRIVASLPIGNGSYRLLLRTLGRVSTSWR